ncbi:MAG: DUF6198 family protein [Clostridia bacterium]|nr:DUF6198 family protein [Clostridia bacterium]
MTQTKTQMIKKLAVYLIGVYFTAFAIAISKMTPLGISPNSSLPNELSLILNVNLGFVTACVFASFVFIQWILLGKDFKLINFVQVLLAILYGYFVNSAVALVNRILPPCDTYPLQLIYTLVSALILGAAIKVYMTPKLMALPAEGLAKAVAQRFKLPFPTAKNICDITIVSISVILSLVYFGKLYGIREGTIIHAFLVGRAVKWSDKLFGRKLEQFVFK